MWLTKLFAGEPKKADESKDYDFREEKTRFESLKRTGITGRFSRGNVATQSGDFFVPIRTETRPGTPAYRSKGEK